MVERSDPRRCVGFLVGLLALAAVGCGGDLDGAGDAASGSGGDGGAQAGGAASAGSSSAATGGDTGSQSGGSAGSGDSGMSSGGTGQNPIDMPQGSVPMFVAVGHMGRTLMSCDDGETWIHDTSVDDSARCFSGGLDCDHDDNAGMGIAYGDGTFIATFGWGAAGGVRRSTDGFTWREVLAGTQLGGIAYGGGVFLGGLRTPRRSTDDGEQWSETGQAIDGWNVRGVLYAAYDGGRFVVVGDRGDVAVSRDGGETFDRPSVPADCGTSLIGLAYGNGVVLLVGYEGTTCRSLDGGATWMLGRIDAPEITSRAIFDGSAFLVWGPGKVYRSQDGASFSSASTSPAGLSPGAVAISDDGTIVAVRGGFGAAYDAQRFYRSQDGTSFEELLASAHERGHPVNHITFGYGNPSVDCPSK